MRIDVLAFLRKVSACFSGDGEYNSRTAPLGLREFVRELRATIRSLRGRVVIAITDDECSMMRMALRNHAVNLNRMISENSLKRYEYQVSEKIIESWGRQAIAADQLAIELETSGK